MTDQRQSGPTDYLAAERTFLAWIRTGLAMMGMGFVVARFGLFLQTLQLGSQAAVPLTLGLSFWFGTGFIILGVAVSCGALRGYLHLMRELKDGGLSFQRPSQLAIGVAIALAVAGLALAVYLISVRDQRPAHSEEWKEKTMAMNPDAGIVTQRSNHSVDETVLKLEEILQAKGVKLFAVIDHSGEAKSAGLEMRPTKLLIFGNPKAGTPLMVAAPTAALDLPLKILVWEDGAGEVQISYNSPAYLQSRHSFPLELVPNIAVVAALAEAGAR